MIKAYTEEIHVQAAGKLEPSSLPFQADQTHQFTWIALTTSLAVFLNRFHAKHIWELQQGLHLSYTLITQSDADKD